jgi:hypothetical protein
VAPKKATGRGRWKACFNATSSTATPSIVIASKAAVRARRKYRDTQTATEHKTVTAATDPRKENSCINRVRLGVANWCTAVRTNASNCCVSPSSISSASHPKKNKAAAAIRRAPRSKNALFTLLGLSMWLDLGRNVARSKLIGRSKLDSPEKTHFAEFGTLLRQAVGYLPSFCTASTSLSPLPFENTGPSIVPPTRKGNCNFPSFNVAPDSWAMVLVKNPSLVVISANPR